MKENEKLIKDENEAIEVIKSNMPTSGYYMLRESLDMAIKALEEVQEYQKIGTVEECREAVKKTKAKKIIKRSFVIPYEGIDACPVCKEPLGRRTKYCRNCGQRLESGE